ncbi:hypothetical protein HK102_008246, partial [Quaeritorhiza haematococci]
CLVLFTTAGAPQPVNIITEPVTDNIKPILTVASCASSSSTSSDSSKTLGWLSYFATFAHTILSTSVTTPSQLCQPVSPSSTTLSTPLHLDPTSPLIATTAGSPCSPVPC